MILPKTGQDKAQGKPLVDRALGNRNRASGLWNWVMSALV